MIYDYCGQYCNKEEDNGNNMMVGMVVGPNSADQLDQHVPLYYITIFESDIRSGRRSGASMCGELRSHC
jgi:hypothetical protein